MEHQLPTLILKHFRYVPDFEVPLSHKGKTPWITYKGQDYTDSQFIVEFLSREMGKVIQSTFDIRIMSVSSYLILISNVILI